VDESVVDLEDVLRVGVEAAPANKGIELGMAAGGAVWASAGEARQAARRTAEAVRLRVD